MLKTVNTDERNQGPKNGDTYCFHGLENTIFLKSQFSPNLIYRLNSISMRIPS